jgi:hypothetical protein
MPYPRRKGTYYGLFGSRGHHRRYLQVFDRKDWNLYLGYGGTVAGLRHRWHRKFYMAYAVKVQHGSTGMVRVIAWFPTILPIRGAGNPPGAFRPFPH